MPNTLNFLERAYQANLYRRRAAEVEQLIQNARLASTKLSLTAELDHCETMAMALDDCEDETETSAPLVKAKHNSDISYIDRAGVSDDVSATEAQAAAVRA